MKKYRYFGIAQTADEYYEDNNRYSRRQTCIYMSNDLQKLRDLMKKHEGEEFIDPRYNIVEIVNEDNPVFGVMSVSGYSRWLGAWDAFSCNFIRDMKENFPRADRKYIIG